MIYALEGKIMAKKSGLAIVEVGGIWFRVFVGAGTLESLPPPGSVVKLFSYLRMREDGIELYGFLSERELSFFELLNTISGIGPKSALNILSIAKTEELFAAIREGRADLFGKASGVGKKTADRIILELKNKVDFHESAEMVKTMESDEDIVEALVAVGYSRVKAKEALSKVDAGLKESSGRFKAAMDMLKQQ
ncbi:Holliday junction DNA helicase RuvA [Candidatus Wolfebacteria bacterium RIFCSPLOWO2_01_FULL_45_19]|uniref:Holliday junction branch migration complex subunit RuvA n=1 Tax=Candidatus Wolfebacteria bacterium RIFCSPLOWO2_01_FULL_45_19 TaxID=1802557 RepID=A0A1F8DTC3_9BACT|nr:MAG: Holliday junction ATP-dependent DNA helicase RuvA [Parcubacteria group bacterium GW2011_GWB1_45_9]OGM91058.1 MAG: Holliday junction DNA helicase RuvA [Candidatus Wolfebacteria bacterium RIFCSPLOWO2_01_FULL_45_19]